MTDPLRKAYAVLGLQPDASASMVREQYLLLAKRWHPDRHANDPTNQRYAADRMREINQAYQLIGELATDQPSPGPPSATSSTDSHAPAVGAWDSSHNEEVIQSILRERGGFLALNLSAGRKASLGVSALYLLGALLTRQGVVVAQMLGFLILLVSALSGR